MREPDPWRNLPIFRDFHVSGNGHNVVVLLDLDRTFSGLPVPFCIDLAVSKCLEQKIHHSLSKI